MRGNVPLADFHAPFAADPGYTSSRGQALFGFCLLDRVRKPVDDHPDSENWRQREHGGGALWEVWDGRSGDVARALFYMDVRYEGDVSPAVAHEPDLVLTGARELISTTALSPA